MGHWIPQRICDHERHWEPLRQFEVIASKLMLRIAPNISCLWWHRQSTGQSSLLPRHLRGKLSCLGKGTSSHWIFNKETIDLFFSFIMIALKLGQKKLFKLRNSGSFSAWNLAETQLSESIRDDWGAGAPGCRLVLNPFPIEKKQNSAAHRLIHLILHQHALWGWS